MSKKSKRNFPGQIKSHARTNSGSIAINPPKSSKQTLEEFSSISPNAQEAIKKLLLDFNITGEILGVVASQDKTFSPVVHDPKGSFPQIIKKIPRLVLADSELNEIVHVNKELFSGIGSFEFNSYSSQGFSVLKRTYALNTLQDALSSSINMPLSQVLFALSKTLIRLVEANKQSVIHGHIHPGNICFKLDLSGDLLDAGILCRRFTKSENLRIEDRFLAPEVRLLRVSSASDVYGFGATLREILKCPSIICSEGDPSREDVLTVLGPVIDAAVKNSATERISLDLLYSMFMDFLPMFSKENPGMIEEEINNSETLLINNKNNPLELEVSGDELLEGEQIVNDHFENDGEQILDNEFDYVEDRYRHSENAQVASVEDYSIQRKDLVQDKFETSSFDLSEELKSRTQNYSSHIFPKLIRAGFFIALMCLIFVLGSKVLKNYGLIQSNLDSQSQFDEFTGQIFDNQNLDSAWSSGIPSQMKLVADQAVYKNPGRVLAERVILGSITNNEVKSELVDASLLRVAFSTQWEEQLNENDRRYALALGLIQILKNQIPRDLGALEDRNPAILLALMSSGSTGVSKFLNNMPVSLLEKLPVPFGPAFELISIDKPSKTCGDPEVIALARFGTRGIENPLIVSQFLSEEFKRRVSALAILFSSQPENARKVLDILLEHPNFSLTNPELNWAKKVSLLDWTDVDPSDQLFLIAGVPLRGNANLTAPSVAKLFLNPSAKVRGYAAGLALNKIQFLHKGAPEILNMVYNMPDILTQNQFVMLGQILEDPKRTAEAHRKIVYGFIASNPPIEIAKHLLIASATEKESTILDSALGIYLGEKGWTPKPEEIQILIHHPDKVIRMLAYQGVFTSMSGPEALGILKKASDKETDEDYKSHLREMISKLSSHAAATNNKNEVGQMNEEN